MSFTGFSFGSSGGSVTGYSGPDFGGGDIFLPGGSTLPPVFANPTFPSNSGGGPSNPGGSWLSQLLPWANLGAQTFLADQAITSPRPSTVTMLPNGQIVATGGGASPLPSVSSIPGVVWIGLGLLLLVMLLKR